MGNRVKDLLPAPLNSSVPSSASPTSAKPGMLMIVGLR